MSRAWTILVSVPALMASGDFVAEPEGGPTTLRVYDVAALLAPVEDEAIPAVGLLPLLDRGGVMPVSRSQREGLNIEALAEILRRTIGDARFEAAGRAMTPTRGGLFVQQTPENHERIRRVLSLLEAAATRRAQVELLLLDIGSGALEKIRGSVLSAAERTALVRDPSVKTIGTYTASGAFGARLSLGAQRSRRILYDYDVEIAEDSAIADPQVVNVFDGLSASVRVLPCGSGSLDVEATAELAVIDDPVRSLPLETTSLGRVELPAFACARVSGTAVVPSGGALVLVAHGALGDGAALAVVISVAASGPEANTFRDDGNATVEARVADFGTAGYPAREFSAPAVHRADPSEFASALHGDLGETQGNRVDSDGFEADDAFPAEAMAAANPDSTFMAPLPSRRSFVLGDPASQAAVSGALEALLASRRRTVEVTIALVPLTPDEAAKEAPAANSDSLLAAARATRDGSTLFIVPIVSGDQAAMALGREFSFVSDYDVEVAQKARVADPQIGFLFSGCAAEVRAMKCDDSSRVVVDVRLSQSRCDAPPRGRWNGGPDLGILEFPMMERSAVSRRLTPEIGKADAAIVGRTSDGRPIALVVAVAEP